MGRRWGAQGEEGEEAETVGERVKEEKARGREGKRRRRRRGGSRRKEGREYI